MNKGGATTCPFGDWVVPEPRIGTVYSYVSAGQDLTVRFSAASIVLDAFGEERSAIEVTETRMEGVTRYWVDAATRLILMMDDDKTLHYAQPYYEWFRREQILGHAPYLLPLVLASEGRLPCSGSVQVPILGQNLTVEGSIMSNLLQLTVSFPHQEAPDFAETMRSTGLVLDAFSGVPIKFDDLLALGRGFNTATLLKSDVGNGPNPWLPHQVAIENHHHPQALELPLADDRIIHADGLLLASQEALDVARQAPGYVSFKTQNPSASLYAAFYEENAAAGIWTFQFAAVKDGASYNIQSNNHDVEVRGRSVQATAALPTAEGNLKEFFDPLFAPRHAGAFGRSGIAHCIAVGRETFGTIEFAYVQQFDPERWPGAEEAVITIIDSDQRDRRLVYSAVNGQILEKSLHSS